MKLDYDKDNVWHVFPEKDIMPHKLDGLDCKCGVKIEVQPNKGVLVSHKFFLGSLGIDTPAKNLTKGVNAKLKQARSKK